MISDQVELSIVICTRNRAMALPACLEALTRVRSRRSWEILMIDNASTDATVDVLGRADDCGGRMRVLRVDRIGLGNARDAAWRACRGAIIAFTDDDCYVAPDYVDAVLSIFDEDPDLACAGGRILLFDRTDIPVAIDERQIREEIRPYSFVPAGKLQGANLSLRRSALEHIGGVDTAFGAGTPFPCEDIDMVAAVSWSGLRSVYDPRPVVEHHHRRKPVDFNRIMAGYDQGRGAYFAKYLLRQDSRKTYCKAWRNTFKQSHVSRRLKIFSREAASAVRYLVFRREYSFLLSCLPLLVWSYLILISRGVRGSIRKASGPISQMMLRKHRAGQL